MNCPICNKGNMTERELEVHNKYFHHQVQYQQPQKIASGICPECKGTLWFQEGCVSCPSCGFSKCG